MEEEETAKEPEPEPKPEVKVLRKRFGRIDHRMRVRFVEIGEVEWKEKTEEEVKEEAEEMAKKEEDLVSRLMKKYSIKEEEDEKQEEEPRTDHEEEGAREEREERREEEQQEKRETEAEQEGEGGEGETNDLKRKLSLMKERLNENKAKLKKEFEEEAQKSEVNNKVKKMDKFVKKGLRRREKMVNLNFYGYPVYKPSKRDKKQREEKRKNEERQKEEQRKEEEARRREQEEKEREEREQREQREQREEQRRAEEARRKQEEEEKEKNTLKSQIKRIIQEKIGAEKKTKKKDNEAEQKAKEPEPTEEAEKQPAAKVKSKRDIKPVKGGYLSRFAKKLKENTDEDKPKKLPRFSSRARRPREVDSDKYSSNPQDPKTGRSQNMPPKRKPVNFTKEIFSKSKKKGKKEVQDDIKFSGTRTIESLGSKDIGMDFSQTIEPKRTRAKNTRSGESKAQRNKKKRQSARKSPVVKKERKKVRMSRRATQESPRRVNNTSLEEVERTPPRIKLAEPEMASKSQLPKKLGVHRRVVTDREMSLGPSKGAGKRDEVLG